MKPHKLKSNLVLALTAAGATLALAACGSSSGPTSSAGSSASNAAATSASPSTRQGAVIATSSGSQGTFLTASGRALYLWVADPRGQSACSGACAQVWPPLLTKGTPMVSGNASSGDVGTITRSDGTKQVTYKGHPLYFYVTDTGPGMTAGQGSNSFGAKWWLVGPSGSAITSAGSSSSSGSPSSAY